MSAAPKPALDELLAAAQRAYPDVNATARVRELFAARHEAAAAAHEPYLRAADLFLAMACAGADPAAIARVDAMLPAILRPALAKIGVVASDDDEIIQRTRVAMLAPAPDRGPGILGYTGRGELRAYLRMVAVRLALKRIEREPAPSPGDDSDLIAFAPDARDSPELALFKQSFRGDLRSAFDSAVAELSPRDRTLLRQHYVDGLSIDKLARIHGAHRATCARWIEAARGSILVSIKRQLRDARGLGPEDLDSAVAAVASHLELSLARQLQSGTTRER